LRQLSSCVAVDFGGGTAVDLRSCPFWGKAAVELRSCRF
jgi:hypothetical protein